jgi:hypothetical protein
MEPVNDAESTIQKLCAQAEAEHNQGRLREVRFRLKSFLHEHASLLISMSEDTYQALRRLRGLRGRRRPAPGALPVALCVRGKP